jgi:hypothetical protein
MGNQSAEFGDWKYLPVSHHLPDRVRSLPRDAVLHVTRAFPSCVTRVDLGDLETQLPRDDIRGARFPNPGRTRNQNRLIEIK